MKQIHPNEHAPYCQHVCAPNFKTMLQILLPGIQTRFLTSAVNDFMFTELKFGKKTHVPKILLQLIANPFYCEMLNSCPPSSQFSVGQLSQKMATQLLSWILLDVTLPFHMPFFLLVQNKQAGFQAARKNLYLNPFQNKLYSLL